MWSCDGVCLDHWHKNAENLFVLRRVDSFCLGWHKNVDSGHDARPDNFDLDVGLGIGGRHAER